VDVTGRLRGGTLLAALIALSVAAATTAAPAQRTRILDRTLLCSIELQGGIYELNVYGRSGVRLRESPSNGRSFRARS
jgi:hypothetical protein